MAVIRTWWPDLADPLEAARIAAPGGDEVHGLPPPGTQLVPAAHPAPWALIAEQSPGSAPDDGRTYWATLAEFQIAVDDPLTIWLARAGQYLTGAGIPGLTLASQWPVVWRADLGETMRWIRTTFRGDLGGGIEQFQFKLDWGNPGSDPTLAEDAAPTYAEALAGRFETVWGNVQANGQLASMYRDNVRFTEVGAVEMERTGGETAQNYATGWFAYPTGSEVKGLTFGSGSETLPFEVAVCVTLQTDTRGPRGRGRCYLPPPITGGMATNGFFKTSVYKAAADFIRDLADAHTSATGHDLVVVSQAATQLHAVTQVKCGQVPDSQRRRRRSQAEAPYAIQIAE